ncbi:hypothetical protein ACF0H5_014407 [Mactra antiquata]
MVYKKSNIKVLLGPENYKTNSAANGTDNEELIQKPVKTTSDSKREKFEKIGETQVYKRTRPAHAFQGKPPTLERYPSNLELSGKRVETDEEKRKAQAAEEKDKENQATVKTGDSHTPDKQDETDRTRDSSAKTNMRDQQSGQESKSASRQKPKQARSSTGNIVFSRNVLTEFGLSPQRTDTFSGHQRRRGYSADIERQFEEQAERHIRTCQTVGNVKWSSRANQGCKGLKSTVSPLQSPMSFCSSDRLHHASMLRDKSFFRSETELDKAGMTSYFSQIRKQISKSKTLTQAYQKRKYLPDINSRTLIVGTGISNS